MTAGNLELEPGPSANLCMVLIALCFMELVLSVNSVNIVINFEYMICSIFSSIKGARNLCIYAYIFV